MDDGLRGDDPTDLPVDPFTVPAGSHGSQNPTPLPVRRSTTSVTVAAELRFLEVVRSAAAVAFDGSGGDVGCARDLELAVDELVSVLLLSARTPSDLQLTFSHDETDAHVHMTVPLASEGFHPQLTGLTRLLLEATADAYDVHTDGHDLIAVLRRRLDTGSII
jgi:hypothetical protein